MNQNILVIDDDSAVRKAFKLALEDSNFNVETASSGEDGVKQITEKDYSIIFLDLKMPGLNGAETLRELR
ncbi:MAG: response regulator, partial [Gammaproteobacteria bacterium]